jgi:F-type H+-transporting ATPase subunit gamma
MATMINLKKKKLVIEEIKRVTESMSLVSMSIYLRIKSKADSLFSMWGLVREALVSLGEQLVICESPCDTSLGEALINKNKKKTLFVVAFSSRGFCGPLNSNLIKLLRSKLVSDNVSNCDFIFLGKHSSNVLIQIFGLSSLVRESKILHSFGRFNMKETDLLASDLFDMLQVETNNYGDIFFAGNDYKNMFSQSPKIRLLWRSRQDFEINIKQSVIDRDTFHPLSSSSDDFIWEQDQEELRKALLDHYFLLTLRVFLAQSSVAESAARFIAMDLAASSSSTQMDHLSFECNKVRQAMITQEVAELSMLLL